MTARPIAPDVAPLAGVALSLSGGGSAVAEAGALLATFGVAVRHGDRAAPGALLAGRGWEHAPGLPPRTVPLAAAYALVAAALVGWRSGARVAVDLDAVAAEVFLPLAVAASTGTEPAAAPSPPRLLPGGGAVCCDLPGDDAEAFERLVGLLGAEASDPEVLAARAQEWRLAVTPYRQRGAHPPVRVEPRRDHSTSSGRPAGPSAGVSRHRDGCPPRERTRPTPRSPLADVVVVDLTAMWSGPLAARLLAELGARVVKVEAPCRPDGLRHSPGGDLFAALDRGKHHEPLDLRGPADRAAFLDLVAGADLVIDNFSPRVVGNLGIDHPRLAAANPAVLTLGLPAFGEGRPERHWVAYGTGVHAAVGLGDVDGGWAAPAVTYPDPLTGFRGAAVAVAMLVARDLGRHPGRRVEAPMADAVAPLLGQPAAGDHLRARDPALGARLAPHLGGPWKAC